MAPLLRMELFSLLGVQIEEAQHCFFHDQAIDAAQTTFVNSVSKVLLRCASFEELLDQVRDVVEPLHDVAFRTPSVAYCEKLTEWHLHQIFPRLAGMKGTINIKKPKNIYNLFRTKDEWVFAYQLTEQDKRWVDHKEKPHTFSSALGQQMARSLVMTLKPVGPRFLDCCCGSGTVLMEAAYSGLETTGIEQNPTVMELARKNLDHFQLAARLLEMNAIDIAEDFDSAVIDFPYGIACHRNPEEELQIMKSLFPRVKQAIFLIIEESREKLEACGYEIIQHEVMKYNKLSRYFYHVQGAL